MGTLVLKVTVLVVVISNSIYYIMLVVIVYSGIKGFTRLPFSFHVQAKEGWPENRIRDLKPHGLLGFNLTSNRRHI